jgi:hypothetical protein
MKRIKTAVLRKKDTLNKAEIEAVLDEIDMLRNVLARVAAATTLTEVRRLATEGR